MKKATKTGQLHRRDVLIGFTATGSAAMLLAACGRGSDNVASCAGPNELTASEAAARNGRGYVEASNVDEETCANCTFFRTGDGDCGTCGIDSLPANPGGHCSSWVAAAQQNETGEG